MNINITPDDIKRISIFSSLNDLGMVYFEKGYTHVMKFNANMIKVTLDNEMPIAFGTKFRKLSSLIAIKTQHSQDRELEVVESKTDPDVLFLKANTEQNITQIPTNPKALLGQYLPVIDNAFALFSKQVNDNEIFSIKPDDDTPSLFDRFNFRLYGDLDIENNNIYIHQEDSGDVVILYANTSINDGAVPAGAKSKTLSESSHYIRAVLCKADDLVTPFPKDKTFCILSSIYTTMQNTPRVFNMTMGSFTFGPHTLYALHFVCDDVEYFNILAEPKT